MEGKLHYPLTCDGLSYYSNIDLSINLDLHLCRISSYCHAPLIFFDGHPYYDCCYLHRNQILHNWRYQKHTLQHNSSLRYFSFCSLSYHVMIIRFRYSCYYQETELIFFRDRHFSRRNLVHHHRKPSKKIRKPTSRETLLPLANIIQSVLPCCVCFVTSYLQF